MCETLFEVLFFLIFYTYIGYGIIIVILVGIKKILFKNKINNDEYYPMVTMLVAAYNEESIIKEKIKNSFELDYPKDKITYLFVTSGSTDKTKEIVSSYDEIIHLHTNERKGKVVAINEGMKLVNTEIVIFSDANAMINENGVKSLVKHYRDSKIGCVAGEKKIKLPNNKNIAGTGEGFYWKYESFLKKYDFKLYTAVGAAGELFSIRTKLFVEVENDVILDDFIISMNIAKRGYKIAYEPNAYAEEFGSASINEEMKRKIRISAGGIQSVVKLSGLLNLFKHGVFSFQYISHRVLRWTITPLALLILFPLNIILIFKSDILTYKLIFIGQILFYLASFLGWKLERKNIKIKLLYVPFYFTFMNCCMILGVLKYLKGSQSVLWEKAKRA